MKKITKKQLKFLLLVAMIFVVGTGVAFAALSATLNITFGSLTQNPIYWSVEFQGNSATPETIGTSSTELECGNATITSTAVTVATSKLSKPGDKCKYTLTIRNGGTLNAKLTNITPSSPSGTTCTTAAGGNMVCGSLTYRLSSSPDGDTVLPIDTILNAGTNTTVYLMIIYNSESLQTVESTQTGAKFSLVYEQV